MQDGFSPFLLDPSALDSWVCRERKRRPSYDKVASQPDSLLPTRLDPPFLFSLGSPPRTLNQTLNHTLRKLACRNLLRRNNPPAAPRGMGIKNPSRRAAPLVPPSPLPLLLKQPPPPLSSTSPGFSSPCSPAVPPPLFQRLTQSSRAARKRKAIDSGPSSSCPILPPPSTEPYSPRVRRSTKGSNSNLLAAGSPSGVHSRGGCADTGVTWREEMGEPAPPHPPSR